MWFYYHLAIQKCKKIHCHFNCILSKVQIQFLDSFKVVKGKLFFVQLDSVSRETRLLQEFPVKLSQAWFSFPLSRYFVFEDCVIWNITDYFKRHYLYLFLWTFLSLGHVKCFFQQNINFCFSFFTGLCLGYFWHLCWPSQFGSNNFQLGWSVTASWHCLNWASGGQQEPERCQHYCECWTS